MQYVGSHREPRPAYLRLPVLGAATGVLVTALAAVVAVNIIGNAPQGTVDVAWAGTTPLFKSTGSPIDQDVEDFVDRCHEAVDDWRAAQISWPAEMALDVGESTTYQVAADIRSAPLPAPTVLGTATATSAAVAMRCAVSARLVPVDSTVKISGGNLDDAGWRPRIFDASGVLEWSWTVQATEIGTHQVRLELKPVAQSTRYQFLDTGQTFTRVTPLEVEGNAVQRALGYVASISTGVKALFGVIIAGIIGLLVALTSIAGAWNGFTKEWGARHNKERVAAEPLPEPDSDVFPFPKPPAHAPPATKTRRIGRKRTTAKKAPAEVDLRPTDKADADKP